MLFMTINPDSYTKSFTFRMSHFPKTVDHLMLFGGVKKPMLRLFNYFEIFCIFFGDINPLINELSNPHKDAIDR